MQCNNLTPVLYLKGWVQASAQYQVAVVQDFVLRFPVFLRIPFMLTWQYDVWSDIGAKGFPGWPWALHSGFLTAECPLTMSLWCLIECCIPSQCYMTAGCYQCFLTLSWCLYFGPGCFLKWIFWIGGCHSERHNCSHITFEMHRCNLKMSNPQVNWFRFPTTSKINS